MTMFNAPEPMVIRGSADAVSAVPYLLGFHPDRSLVAVGYEGPLGTCVVRVDLVGPEESPHICEQIGKAILGNRFGSVYLVGYGPDDEVRPLAAEVAAFLAAGGVRVREVLRVADGRWYACCCDDPEHCPPEGTLFDISTTTVAAKATLAGTVAFPSRADLVRSISPVGGPARASMRSATLAAEHRLAQAQQAARRAPIGTVQPGGPRVSEGIPLVERVIAGLPALPGHDEIAWLGVLLTHVRVRDEAWVRIDFDDPGPHLVLWREVLRHVTDPYVPAPACLLAYAAFVGSEGSLAGVALDRALTADPTYSMALLLRDVIQSGLPPSAARLQLRPEDLAIAYNDFDLSDDSCPTPD